jgi:hypothetical protein
MAGLQVLLAGGDFRGLARVQVSGRSLTRQRQGRILLEKRPWLMRIGALAWSPGMPGWDSEIVNGAERKGLGDFAPRCVLLGAASH